MAADLEVEIAVEIATESAGGGAYHIICLATLRPNVILTMRNCLLPVQCSLVAIHAVAAHV